MNKYLKRASLLVAPIVLATSTQVSAHAGSHSEPSFSAVIHHLLSSPYHMGLIIGVTLLAVIAWKKRTKKQSNSSIN